MNIYKGNIIKYENEILKLSHVLTRISVLRLIVFFISIILITILANERLINLELAKLAGKEMWVSNFSFNSEIHDDDMFFNYKITPGICKDFNASELMKRSGIKILPEKD